MERSKPPLSVCKVQEAGSILRIDFALLKLLILYGAYLVTMRFDLILAEGYYITRKSCA